MDDDRRIPKSQYNNWVADEITNNTNQPWNKKGKLKMIARHPILLHNAIGGRMVENQRMICSGSSNHH